MSRNVKVAATAVVGLVATGAAVMLAQGSLTLQEFVALVASAGFLGTLASVLLTLIRIAFPVIDEEYAMISSVLLAAVVSALARAILPFLDKLPAAVNDYWPIIVWLAQQVWFSLTKTSKFNGIARRRALGPTSPS